MLVPTGVWVVLGALLYGAMVVFSSAVFGALGTFCEVSSSFASLFWPVTLPFGVLDYLADESYKKGKQWNS